MDSREVAMDFKKMFPDMVIGSIMDGGNCLLVHLTKKGIASGNFIVDNDYKYDKRTKKIIPFKPSDDLNLYRRAERHILYMRPGLRDE